MQSSSLLIFLGSKHVNILDVENISKPCGEPFVWDRFLELLHAELLRTEFFF